MSFSGTCHDPIDTQALPPFPRLSDLDLLPHQLLVEAAPPVALTPCALGVPLALRARERRCEQRAMSCPNAMSRHVLGMSECPAL